MTLFRNIFIISVLATFIGAQVSYAQNETGDTLTVLHRQCESAYRLNDFNRMKETIDTRTEIIQRDSLQEMNGYERNSHLALYLKDLGSYHYCIADIDGTSYDSAESFYSRSLDIYENELKDSHGASVIRNELAQMHYKTGDFEKALDLLQKNRQHYYETGVESMELLTWAEAALCKAQLCQFTEAVCDIDSVILFTPKWESPQENIRKNGKIMLLQAEVSQSRYEQAVPYFADYFLHQKDSITTAFRSMTPGERERYWMRMRPFISDCYRLEDYAAGLLYDVALFSKSILLQFSGIRPDHKVAPGWNEIQKHLKEDECAVEFIHYEKKGTMHLGAVMVKKTGEPEFFPIIDVEGFMDFRLDGHIPVREAVQKEVPSYKNALYTNQKLNQMIWSKEIRSYLKGISKVYFAADGIFHKIAIEYMYPERKAPEFRRLTSTRELLNEYEEISGNGMLICGGVDYFADNAGSDTTGNDKLAYDLLARQHAYFRPLKGAMTEVSEIFTLRNNPADTLIVDSHASETGLGSIMNKYPYITIATHGYYAGTDSRSGTDLKTHDTDYMLSQSVLIMAGAQKNLDNFDFDPDHKDGIMSAREISGMDLTRVRLITVSACQSGIGKITPDGVFGIQRGLKNAGVQSMIVSLWEVDDEATRHFMVNFNKALSDGRNIGESFTIARESMSDEIEITETGLDSATMSESDPVTIRRKRFDKPQYKNAFILIDNPL